MRISWNWLRRYVDLDIDPKEAADILTSTGLETESVELFEPVKGMLKGVIVGEVLQCEKHPDADRLRVCMVDLGKDDPVQIVCGAPNVAKGQKVLVATVSTTLNMKDGTSLTIKKSKIRGQESNGMICAEDELGLGEGHDGIMVLPPDAEIGASAETQLGLTSDHVLEIGLTPNRTDAMGHLGVARDLVAALNHRNGSALKLKFPDVSTFGQDGEGSAVKVEVKDPVACPRYAGVTLDGIKVGPSPEWLQQLLKAIGLKPINNVVDVTNFVQHELGQPLHAFDADRLAGNSIVVRKAASAEPFRTLDGKDRKLNGADLVIADGEKSACIAGVFGGENSGVTDLTTRVFLESALFQPASIRATARRHGLNTDASFRFERGVDPEITVYALKRAALLLKEIAGARIVSPITDINSIDPKWKEVKLSFDEIGKLTGLSIPKNEVTGILASLDFKIKESDERTLTLAVPPYRVDVTRPADVIEEILRIHGFDHVPLPERLMVPAVPHEGFNMESLRHQLGSHLAARGFREIMTPSLTSGEKGSAFTGDLVRLKNPLSTELDVLRPSMLPGMLQAIAYNINRQHRDLRFFERGRIYFQKDGASVEMDHLAIAITGALGPDRWRSGRRKVELHDAKEELESILERLGILDRMEWSPIEDAHLQQGHRVLVKEKAIATIGEVPPATLEQYDVNQPVFFASMDEQLLLELCREEKIVFREVAKFPSVRRDLSLLLDEQIRFDQLKKIAFSAERKLLREVDLFDVYQGEKLPKGKKSYALSFILQDSEHTLTDEQVEKAMGRIKSSIEKETGAELRA